MFRCRVVTAGIINMCKAFFPFYSTDCRPLTIKPDPEILDPDIPAKSPTRHSRNQMPVDGKIFRRFVEDFIGKR